MGFISERSTISQVGEIPISNLFVYFAFIVYFILIIYSQILLKITSIFIIKNYSLTTVEFMDYEVLVSELQIKDGFWDSELLRNHLSFQILNVFST